tara:strand:- start:13077 stop:13325 length:249 start_codon:yes stop_codon:yes gene_type:complete
MRAVHIRIELGTGEKSALARVRKELGADEKKVGSKAFCKTQTKTSLSSLCVSVESFTTLPLRSVYYYYKINIAVILLYLSKI